MSNNTFLIKSTDNRSFGTGFCVHKDEKGAFLITCAHVVEACNKTFLEVNEHKATLLFIGSSKDIDLAVVYVDALKEVETLPLLEEMKEITTPFTLDGFKIHRDGTHLERPLNGVIQNISQIHNNNKIVSTYELKIEDAYSIEKGYSGSALIVNGRVIGVATDKHSNGKQAYAIPIKYLKEIWKDMPKGLFVQNIDTENKFRQEVLNTSNNDSLPIPSRSNNTFIIIIFIFLISGIQLFLYESKISAIGELVNTGVDSFTALLYVLFAVTIGSPLIVLFMLQNGLEMDEIPLLITGTTNSILFMFLIRNFVHSIYYQWFKNERRK